MQNYDERHTSCMNRATTCQLHKLNNLWHHWVAEDPQYNSTLRELGSWRESTHITATQPTPPPTAISANKSCLRAAPPRGTWTHHWRSEGRPNRTLELVAQGSKPSTDGMNVGREITKSSLPRGAHELTPVPQPWSSWAGESSLSSTWELKSCMLQCLKTAGRHARQWNSQSDIIGQLNSSLRCPGNHVSRIQTS